MGRCLLNITANHEPCGWIRTKAHLFSILFPQYPTFGKPVNRTWQSAGFKLQFRAWIKEVISLWIARENGKIFQNKARRRRFSIVLDCKTSYDRARISTLPGPRGTFGNKRIVVDTCKILPSQKKHQWCWGIPTKKHNRQNYTLPRTFWELYFWELY